MCCALLLALVFTPGFLCWGRIIYCKLSQHVLLLSIGYLLWLTTNFCFEIPATVVINKELLTEKVTHRK
jgi:hypothetical protein